MKSLVAAALFGWLSLPQPEPAYTHVLVGNAADATGEGSPTPSTSSTAS